MENKQYISTDFFTENGGFFNEKKCFCRLFLHCHLIPKCQHYVFAAITQVHLRLKAKAHQGRQDHQQGDDFALDILLVEAEDAVDERHDEAHAVEDERDEHHHSSFLFEAREVDDIGYGNKHRHSNDAPTPLKGLFFPIGPPNEAEKYRHHQEVVNRVPCLNGRRRNALLAEEELVVNTAQSHQNRRPEQHIHPLVRLEMDALQLARTVHKVERNDGQNHASPLQPSQALTENEKHQDNRDGRPELVDWPDHSDGQVFHGRIAEHP